MPVNPWLTIPLEEYEAHMSMESVAQAQFIAGTIATCVRRFNPGSVAVLGCAGGNGFDELARASVRRVVGVDINPDYLATVRQRFEGRFETLELYCDDLTASACTFAPVDLVCAALVFEYVDYRAALASVTRFLVPGGFLSVILQLPHDDLPAVSASPYQSVKVLAGVMNLVPPALLESGARTHGLSTRLEKRIVLPSGKAFHEFLFQNG